MRQIWKYELKLGDTQTVVMPEDAEVLTVQIQRNTACLWAIVNPSHDNEERRFAIFGTGHPIPNDMDLLYIGTYQLQGGSLVFHVFEIEN